MCTCRTAKRFLSVIALALSTAAAATAVAQPSPKREGRRHDEVSDLAARSLTVLAGAPDTRRARGGAVHDRQPR